MWQKEFDLVIEPNKRISLIPTSDSKSDSSRNEKIKKAKDKKSNSKLIAGIVAVNLAIETAMGISLYNMMNFNNTVVETIGNLSDIAIDNQLTIDVLEAKVSELENQLNNNKVKQNKQSDKDDIHQLEVMSKSSENIIDSEPADTAEKGFVFLDVDLSNELQKYTYNIADEYEVPFTMLMAIMCTESAFKDGLSHINSNGTVDYGLMQINSSCWEYVRDKYNLDIKDTYDNIEAGAALLSEYWCKYEPLESITAYGLGEQGFLNNGVSSHSKIVMELAIEYDDMIANGGYAVEDKAIE